MWGRLKGLAPDTHRRVVGNMCRGTLLFIYCLIKRWHLWHHKHTLLLLSSIKDHWLYFLWSCGRILDKVCVGSGIHAAPFPGSQGRGGRVGLALPINFLHHHSKILRTGRLKQQIPLFFYSHIEPAVVFLSLAGRWAPFTHVLTRSFLCVFTSLLRTSVRVGEGLDQRALASL